MNRRELLMLSVATVFLTASRTSFSGVSGGTITAPPTTAGLSAPSIDFQEARRLINSYIEVMMSPEAAAIYLANPTNYFSSRGFKADLVKEYSTVMPALKTIAQPDFQTAMDIGDADYILAEARRTGLVTKDQANKFTDQVIELAIGSQHNVPLSAKEISGQVLEFFKGNLTTKTIPSALLLAVAFATMTNPEPGSTTNLGSV